MNARLSSYALILLCAVTVAVRCTMPQRQVLTWDVFGYYHQDLHYWLLHSCSRSELLYNQHARLLVKL